MTDCKLVSVEPVLYVAKDAIEDSEVVGMHAVRHPNGLHNFPLYTAPQPARDITRLVEALEQIRAIEDELYGGDWDEIEKARNIANEALSAHHKGEE